MNKRVLSFLAPGISFWVRSDSVRRWRIVLGVLAGATVIALLVTTKPWVAVTEIRGKTDTLDYVRIYGWIAGAINVVLLACLAILCPWWAKLRDLRPAAAVERSATPRWFWPLVIVAMATTFFYSLPRMTHGFWDDEELNVRTTLWGKFKPNKKTGEVEFVRFDWLETIYGYSKGPNTHTLFSYSFSRVRGSLEPRRQAKGFSVGRVAVSCAGTHFWRPGSRGFRMATTGFRNAGDRCGGSVAACSSPMEYSLCERSARIQLRHLYYSGAFRLLAKSDGHRLLALVERLCSR